MSVCVCVCMLVCRFVSVCMCVCVCVSVCVSVCFQQHRMRQKIFKLGSEIFNLHLPRSVT